jgi:DNA-binding beta-propeller fold protein YncE
MKSKDMTARPWRRRSKRLTALGLILAIGLSVVSAPALALLTNTFIGRVDAAGTKYRAHIFDVVDAGAIDATLDWTNSTAANLNLLLYREEAGGTWTIVATANSTTQRPETIQYANGTVGRWKVAAKAISGAADYTLTVQHSPGGTPPPASVATYSSAFGFKGPAGEYPYGMDFDPTDGTILVGDVWNYRAKRYTTSGDFIRVVTQHADRNELGGAGAPFDVEADPDGDVWIADQSNSRIVEFSHNGAWKQTIGMGGGPEAWKNYPQGCGGGKLWIPTHIVVHPTTKDIYVSDVRCRDVYVFDHTGHFKFDFDFNLSGCCGVFTPIPRGIGFDNGLIYVVEHNSRRIVVFDAAGNQLAVSARQADMNDPRGLDIDNAGNRLYVVGAYRNEAFQFSIAGQSVNFMEKWNTWGALPFGSVRWPAVDAQGNIYISDTFQHRVWKFDSDLNPLPWNQPPQPPPDGGWNQVNGIGVSPNGRVYGIDHFGNRVQRFRTLGTDPATGQPWRCLSAANCGAFELQFGTRESVGQGSEGFTNPTALIFGDGQVWADGGHAVIVFDADGNFLRRFGTHGQQPGQFGNGPLGIRVIADGNPGTLDGLVYTTDATSCRVQVFTQTGTLTDYMGSCGTGTNQMTGPRQLDVDGDLVYVADTGRNRIAVWDTDTNTIVGTVTATFAGKKLSGPRGVLLDPTGTWLYIGDTKNARVVRIRVGANGITFTDPQVASTGADTPEGKFKGPEWMEFGPDGRLFVSDNNQRIYAFEITG